MGAISCLSTTAELPPPALVVRAFISQFSFLGPGPAPPPDFFIAAHHDLAMFKPMAGGQAKTVDFPDVKWSSNWGVDPT